jgi:hypothetical protein
LSANRAGEDVVKLARMDDRVGTKPGSVACGKKSKDPETVPNGGLFLVNRFPFVSRCAVYKIMYFIDNIDIYMELNVFI